MTIHIDVSRRVIEVKKGLTPTQLQELHDYMAIYPTYQVIYVDDI